MIDDLGPFEGPAERRHIADVTPDDFGIQSIDRPGIDMDQAARAGAFFYQSAHQVGPDMPAGAGYYHLHLDSIIT